MSVNICTAKLLTQAVSNNNCTSGKNKHTNGQTNTASTTDTWTKAGRAYYNDTCQNIELAKIIARLEAIQKYEPSPH